MLDGLMLSCWFCVYELPVIDRCTMTGAKQRGLGYRGGLYDDPGVAMVPCTVTCMHR
jgi:hypothetical protein